MKTKEMPPRTTFVSLASVGLLCFCMMSITPDGGFRFGSFQLKFKTLASILDTSTHNAITDVGAYLASLDSIKSDSVATDSITTDSIHKLIRRVQTKTSLQFATKDASVLFPFFEALNDAKAKGTNIHILHYGDSQIESDRMTGYIREKLQKEFGGTGPGIVSAYPITASASIAQSQSSNWKRFTAYGFDNGKAGHARYGIMAAISRFTPIKKPEEIDLTDTTEAWIEYRPSSIAHSNTRVYSNVALYLGNNLHPIDLKVVVNDSAIAAETIEAGTSIRRKQWNIGFTPKKLRFEFRGVDSPDIHAVILESPGGVHMDNLALRGSNGNIFKRIAQAELSSQIADLNTKLIVLQFGGNSIPYLESEADANKYGNYFQAQIQYLKKLAPGCSFIVVGPSDMSTSIDGVWQSWPFIEETRDAMKTAAFAEGCAFWDMYEVMGGKDSMVSWVTNDPPYAGSDYTHFTPLGARKMAELLYKAIDNEYDLWMTAKEEAK